jgi:hypothetical protein
MRRYLIKIALLAIIGFWLWGWFDPFRFAAKGNVPQTPTLAETDVKPFIFRPYTLFPRTFLIKPRMAYDITGRILHKRQYFMPSYFGDLIPFDFALGWQDMANLNIIRPYMKFDHAAAHAMGRYYMYKYHWDDNTPPAYVSAMTDNSNKSNNHLIPANAEIFWKLWMAGTGDIVHLKGYLVDIEWPDKPGWVWKTALIPSENHFSQWDDDNPDCQTIFVTEVN